MTDWIQRQIELPAMRAGFHLVTDQIVSQMPEIAKYRVGMLHVFLLHTSAALTINENADPDVRRDLEMALDHIAPQNLPYVHTVEGPDDMPAHVKTSLMGCGLWIPVRDGRLVMGTWQGIYLCEFRHAVHRRRVIATAMGQFAEPAG